MQRNVLDYLEKSANDFPQKIAYTDENTSLTFEMVRNEAIKIASGIINKNDSINSPIVVFVDRNVRCLEAFFGVLYSGNYYVPVDNKMPQKRIEEVLNQVNPKLIVYLKSDENLVENFNEYDNLCIEDALNENAKFIDEIVLKKRVDRILDVDPVYVIFTSGSTGVPKGIVISHRSVIDFIDWMAEACTITSENVMGNQAPFYFDLSVKDIYLTLKCSATMHILPQKAISFPVVLIDYLNDKKINTLIWATSAFHLVASSNVLEKKSPMYLSKVIVGGEALLAGKLNIWKKALPNITYINLYGPTEVTVDCTYYIVDRSFEDYEAVPIGKPCENKQIILLGEDLKEVKTGEIGEICVRGTGLAKGYFKDAEKTNSAFIQNPLNPNFPDIIYKTGDLGKMGEDGLIYFEARKDGQIKHMGYRIEIGEIERAINSFEMIAVAVCIYERETDKIVCFYEGETTEKEIINYIKNLIPKYMFPNKMIKLEHMPYNANGKIDRTFLKQNMKK